MQINSTLFPPSNLHQGKNTTQQQLFQQLQAAGPNGIWYIQALTLNSAAHEPERPVLSQAAGGIAGRLAGRLLDLAEQVRRLDPPGRIDPERFWVDKSEIAARLDELAGEAERRLQDGR